MKYIFCICFVVCSFCTIVHADNIDCSTVAKVGSNSKEYKRITDVMNKMVGKYDHTIKVDKIQILNKKNDWYMVDCTFKNVDAGIFVLHKHSGKIKVVEEMSGDIRDGKEGKLEEIVTKYFVKYAPGVPKDLVYCTAKERVKYWE